MSTGNNSIRTQLELMAEVSGNQLGNGPAARRFFELRSSKCRVGDCLVWHALEVAVAESGNTELASKMAGIKTG